MNSEIIAGLKEIQKYHREQSRIHVPKLTKSSDETERYFSDRLRKRREKHVQWAKALRELLEALS